MSEDVMLTVPPKVAPPETVVVVEPLIVTEEAMLVPVIVTLPVEVKLSAPEFVIVPPEKEFALAELIVNVFPFISMFPEKVRDAIVGLMSSVQTSALLIVTLDAPVGTPTGLQLFGLFQ
jgi:hypothetical protein